jgi:hypothetical protein
MMTPYPAEYHVEQRSSTAGSTAYVLLAASLALASQQPMPRAAFPAVHPVVRPSTIGQFGNLIGTTPHNTQTVDFEGAVTAFYTGLLAKQQPLGKEFEKVLYDNLWDLYVRS